MERRFFKNDALVAPKLNNLYNQKSIDIVDKFKRMYKINRIAILVFAFCSITYVLFKKYRTWALLCFPYLPLSHLLQINSVKN
jgi:hypothetical protein